MKRWLVQVVAALVVLIALRTVYELAGVDTNIDTGNTVAIGLAELVLVWLLVACLGLTVSFLARVLRRRRR
jgi:hypothetical protein